MENELLDAEIYLHPVNTSDATAEIDAELNRIQESLKSYTCTASLLDYAVAAISGILAGAIDVFLIKDTVPVGGNQKPVREQLTEGIQRIESKEKIPKTAMHAAVKPSISGINPVLEKCASRADPIGLAAAVLLQLNYIGIQDSKEKKTKILPEGLSKADGTILVVAAAFVGILKWLSSISEIREEEQPDTGFRLLSRIQALIRSAPAFRSVVNEIEKWQKQLPNELKCSKGNKDDAPGIERVFSSFFIMLGGLPAFHDTNLNKAVNMIQQARRLGLNEVPVIRSLSRQAFPVLINEIIVRTVFFAGRLAGELSGKEGISDIDWRKVVPFGNRDIDRMLAISSLTLATADIADAALHAAMDSGGEMALFMTKFVTRFNFVAAGRAVVALTKEISNERAEAELIHMKRLLTESKTVKALEILQNYQQQLEKRVSEYLAEDLKTFLEGFDCMDQGLKEKNSDLVIKGNVMIQRVLGREPQFKNQQEFNDLMDSDTALKL